MWTRGTKWNGTNGALEQFGSQKISSTISLIKFYWYMWKTNVTNVVERFEMEQRDVQIFKLHQ